MTDLSPATATPSSTTVATKPSVAVFDPTEAGQAINVVFDKWQSSEKKTKDYRDTLVTMLRDAHGKVADFKAFVETYTKVSRATAYRMLQITDQRVSRETRKTPAPVTLNGQSLTREQIDAMGPKVVAKISGAVDPAGYAKEIINGNGVDPTESAAQRGALYEDPTEAKRKLPTIIEQQQQPTFTNEQKEALKQLRQWGRNHDDHLTKAVLLEARIIIAARDWGQP